MPSVGTLLLTDVVDSTALTQTLGDAAAAELWTAHDRVARDLLLQWSGREIDKTDGMLVLFGQVADALDYARAYHAALRDLNPPLQARAAVHVGPVILRHNPAEDVVRGAKPLEVEGLAKPTVARVMALAPAGTTLLTAEAARLMAHVQDQRDKSDRSPESPRLHSHGYWRLKGLSGPLEVLEWVSPDARPDSIPDSMTAQRVVPHHGGWRPATEVPHNLPAWTGAFVGRQDERQELSQALQRQRLVTVMGMGGMGKTRLAVQVALDRLHDFPDGAWFLDLSSLRDGRLIEQQLRQLLQLREEPGQSLAQALRSQARDRRALIVLDNCEHLVDAAAAVAHAVLQHTACLQILATSREALGVPEECSLPLAPLGVPSPQADTAALAAHPASELFMRRALQSRPTLEFTPADAGTVAAIVNRLEGIPLAIELAAARVRSLSLADLATRLDDRYRLLTGGARVLHPRQQTLRALVDWSYELLDALERRMFQKVAVFEGSFDLTAAESICAGDDIPTDAVADLLAALVDRSLLSLDARRGSTRYRMLDTLRDYAREHLQDSGDEQALAQRHCLYYFDTLKRAMRMEMGDQATGVAWLDANLDNIRAGIRLSLDRRTDPFIAVKYASFMQDFWLQRAMFAEGRRVLEAALQAPEVQASEMALSHALYVSASLAGEQGEHEAARDLLQRCLAIRRSLERPLEVAGALSTLALEMAALGDLQAAIAHEEEALSLFTSLGSTRGMLIARLHIGRYRMLAADPVAARAPFEQALTLAMASDDREMEAAALWWLAEADMRELRLADAAQRLQKALSLAQSLGDLSRVVRTCASQAHLALLQEDAEGARQGLTEVLPRLVDLGLREDAVGALEDVSRWMALSAASAALAADFTRQVQELRQRLRLPSALRPRPPVELTTSTAEEPVQAEAFPGLESLVRVALERLQVG